MADPRLVLQLSARYLPDLGGLETHVAEVAGRLQQQPGLEITVATTDRLGEYPAFDFSGQVPVVRCGAWPASRDWYVAPGLARVVRRGGWDLVHVQGVHTLAPVIGMRAARRAGIPYVVSFHSGGSSSGLRRALRGVQWRLLRSLLLDADRLIAVSRFEQRRFAAALGVGVERIEVIENGGGLPEPDPVPVPVPGRILSIGRLERYKGHHRAVEALPLVLRQVPEAHLQILGSGPYEKELHALAARLGVADRVSIRLVPPTDRMAMAVGLGQSAVVSALSDYEAHPVAVMEALSAGVPVVGTDIAGVGDLVEDGLVTGVAVTAGPEVVADALIRAMGQGRGPRRPVPTWEQATERILEVYAQALGRSSYRGVEAVGARPA